MRGPQAQQVVKVKGHATSDDVQSGEVRQVDKRGNDNADTPADYGVEELGGKSLVRTTNWLAQRSAKYGAMIRNIHGVIIKITIAEKEERAKRNKVEATIRGYDPDKEANADGNLRRHEELTSEEAVCPI